MIIRPATRILAALAMLVVAVPSHAQTLGAIAGAVKDASGSADFVFFGIAMICSFGRVCCRCEEFFIHTIDQLIQIKMHPRQKPLERMPAVLLAAGCAQRRR